MYADINTPLASLRTFPPIDAERRIREINDLFVHYIFVRHKKNKEFEYWTSCCNRHEQYPLPLRTETPQVSLLMWAEHNFKDHCPFCGRHVTFKEYRYLGTKKKLKEYNPVVILTESGGDVYARAYWCMKDYTHLDGLPTVYSPAVYHFSAKRHWASMIREPEEERPMIICQEGSFSTNEACIKEPFIEGGWCMANYAPYYVLGLEELDKSDLKYCEYQHYATIHDYQYRYVGKQKMLLRFLTVAALYPEKVEMLIKRGFSDVVNDLVEYRRKNSSWFNWDATDPKKMFKLSKSEIKEALAEGIPTHLLREYPSAKKRGLDLNTFQLHFRGSSWHAFNKFLRTRQIPFEVGFDYVTRQMRKRRNSFSGTVQEWDGYLNMAEALGWDLSVASVYAPPRLHERHEEAVAETNARRDRERAERIALQQKEFAERAEIWRKKYNIEAEGYFIRVAETAEEILAEGRSLSHCVGGYAERHLNGSTTILFLRRTDNPDKSLYTIQMTGNKLMQIHGYKNDVLFGSVDPQIAMDWLLSPWLKWINAGSPRDKNGNPKIKIHKPLEETA